ncbi:HNH endonuclease [Sphingomonas hylomeconis]|uniref:HNH endonuclease n=1 Tax=Sphingomonas hylomeconis TaxID=1395958 RepID=A0ABV7SV73_9SPHN|nr:HNH endonuclease [Sphingomonas hylomeconis]
MLRRDKEELLAKFEGALHLSGWQLIWIQYDHPAKARLFRADGSSPAIDVWLYIWNLTGGGRDGSRPLERRIQRTGRGNVFRGEPGTRSLILGWSAETQVFAAFDYSYHAVAHGKSPSLQTDLPALEAALRDGLGVYAKKTGELSIAVRPDMLGFYVEQMEVLHESGKDPAQLEVLRRMASSPLDVEPSDVPKPRRKAMVTTLRLLRDRRFSQNVLDAYGHKCAFCAVQLKLLDAAHILPVAHPDSHDLVPNGVALCALHHRAYDGALVTFDDTFVIRLSQSKVAALRGDNRSGGLAAFKSALRPSLLLPRRQISHPSTVMIQKGNQLRGWT